MADIDPPDPRRTINQVIVRLGRQGARIGLFAKFTDSLFRQNDGVGQEPGPIMVSPPVGPG
jgi:hypothetical protein